MLNCETLYYMYKKTKSRSDEFIEYDCPLRILYIPNDSAKAIISYCSYVCIHFSNLFFIYLAESCAELHLGFSLMRGPGGWWGQTRQLPSEDCSFIRDIIRVFSLTCLN